MSLFPTSLSHCIEKITRPVLKTKGLAGTRIINEWPSVVGEELARRCYPEQLSFPSGKKSGGTLTLAAENGFATEIQHMEPLILERLASYFGYKAVSRISITHTYVPEQQPATVQKRSATLTAASANLADTVEDPELRTALQNMAKTLSGQ